MTVGGNDRTVLVWETDFSSNNNLHRHGEDEEDHTRVTEDEQAEIEDSLIDQSKITKQRFKDQRKEAELKA